MASVKCPKCGNDSFLVKFSGDLDINPAANFGSIKYNWIEKVVCGNIECSYEFEVTDENLQVILGVAKNVLLAAKEETLIVK